MKKYCVDKNIGFRILLILDNASAQVLDYVGLSEKVKIIYMPPRTPPVMQSTHQGVISALKSCCLCHILIQPLVENECRNYITS
jgi:hypothetical protein